jgi:quinol monooxygenase YgiN
MAVVLITYAPSREAYEALTDDVGHDAPPGCIVHTASEVDGRVRVVDVWESQQHIDEFFQSKLGPAFAKHGIEADRPELTETFNIERG